MKFFPIALKATIFAASAYAIPGFAVDVNWRSIVEQQHSSDSALFPAENQWQTVQALDFAAEHDGVRVAATAWHQQWIGESTSAFTLSELFYDFSMADWQWSLGKKKLDWDVSYGFRPLDMFSPTDPLAVYTAVAPGVWQAQAEYLTADGALSLLCNQSRAEFSIAGEQIAGAWGCGTRWYQRLTDWELQWVAHYDAQSKTRVGFSAVSVLSEALEFHTSALWQQRFMTSEFSAEALLANSFINPVEATWQQGAWQGVAGINYSFESGVNLIAEYWYDGRSPADQQWRDLLQQVPLQAAALDSDPRARHYLLTERQMFSSQNLFQHNVMLHLRVANDHWRPELTLVYNPVDPTLLINGKLCYYWSEGHQLSLGFRRYAGQPAGIYRQLSFDQSIYLGAEFVF